MKHLFTAFFVALTFTAFAPPADASCGKCGNDAKAHAHEPGHNHDDEAAECAACGNAKADCECEKEAAECAACGQPKADCTCEKS